MSEPVEIQVQGGPTLDPQFGERWNAAMVRYLLETPGTLDDWFAMPHSERLALAEREPAPTGESRARVTHAFEVLRATE